MNCELRCDRALVGVIRNVFESDRTWYGAIDPTLQQRDPPLDARVEEFISFCVDWHRRLDDHQDEPPDAVEFEEFKDVLRPGRWSVAWPDGREDKLHQAPVFFAGGEVTWSLETDTSER